LQYLKERELVDQHDSFFCAAGDTLAVPRAARHCYGLDLESRVRDSETAVFMSQLLESRRLPHSRAPAPGRTPRETGAGAERELGFDPQPKAELAQGEYKGAREALARHVHTAEPRGGPGGC
jgi:hypothetical protein